VALMIVGVPIPLGNPARFTLGLVPVTLACASGVDDIVGRTHTLP